MSLHAGLCIHIPPPEPEAEPPNPDASPVSQAHQPTCSESDESPLSYKTEDKPFVTGTNLYNCNRTLRRPQARVPGSHVSLRSTRGMQGLLLAESGGGLVELDPLGGGSGFKQGTLVMPGLVTPRGGASGGTVSLGPRHLNRQRKETISTSRGIGQGLTRNGTLLSQGATPARNAAELKSLLGNSRSKVKSGARILPSPNMLDHKKSRDSDPTVIALEQGKSCARVEVDILLDSEMCVESAYLSGKLHIKVRKRGIKEAPILLGGGKVRVVGFEAIPNDNDRHTFYQHAAPLSAISASCHILYASPPDEEGFSKAREGRHIVPFAMKLPVSDGVHVGAKGPFDSRTGVVVKYIALASFKLKDSVTSKRSIAHFYRSCELYPYLDPSVVLAPASHPILSTAARKLFLGGTGKLKLTASLHRNVWVAGQKCCVGIAVHNETKKSVKGLTLSLIRTTTVFQPHPHLDVASPSSVDPDACQTTTISKLVAETTLEVGQRGLRGLVTAKGWWCGVDPGVQTNFVHFILLPPDALSIVRSRLLEVQYLIRVSLIAGSLSSELSVTLPLRIINHFSIDPPPSYPATFDQPGIHVPVPPLPIPSGSNAFISTPPALPRCASMRDLRKGATRGRKDRLAFIFDDDTDSRDTGRSSGAATISAGGYGGSLPPRMPFMPSLDEDIESDAQRFSDDDLDDVFAEGRSLHESSEYESGEHSGDGWRNNKMETSPVGDSDDILGDWNAQDSEDEVGFVVGSARLEEDFEHKVTRFAELHVRNETFAVPQEYDQPKPSSQSSYSRLSVEDQEEEGQAILQKQVRLGKLTPTANVRPKLRPQTSDSVPRPTNLSVKNRTESRFRGNVLETTPPLPGQLPKNTRDIAPRGSSQFSQRVERLMAARRVQPTISRTTSESDGDGKLGEPTKRTQATSFVSEASPSNHTGKKSTALQASASTLRRPPNDPPPPSKVPIATNGSAVTSGSVRSRIAELEVRTKAIPGLALSVSGHSYSRGGRSRKT